MTPQQINDQLDKVLETFQTESQFLTDTFSQSHTDERLTKQDMEEMNRLTYYTLLDFKNIIVKYAKQQTVNK